MADELYRLQQWYLSQCNADWEHTYGLKIENIDNPGWALNVQLSDTALQYVPFNSVAVERSEGDWIRYAVTEMEFRGLGGANNLDEILDVFLAWAEKHRLSSA